MKKLQIKKHVMTGISYMIPVVVAGGILYGLAKGFGGWDIGTKAEATDFWTVLWFHVNTLGATAMLFSVPVMTAGVAYSIADRPGIAPALIIGYISVSIKAGFLGGLLMGLIIGYLIVWMKTWKLPNWLTGLMPVMIIPVVATFICGVAFLLILNKPIVWLMDALTTWIMGMQSGSKFILGAVIGACMGFDLGGPVNKTASAVANALGADGVYGPMSSKIVGGMTPPLGIGLAALVVPKKFTKTEIELAKTAVPMGLCFITEGVLPFAAADPVRVIISTMAGSAVAGGMTLAFGVESVAGHGGIFVVPMMDRPWLFLLALLAGSVVTAALYAVLKKKPTDEEVAVAEEIIDLDVDIKIG